VLRLECRRSSLSRELFGRRTGEQMTLHLSVPRTGSASGKEITNETVHVNANGFVVASKQAKGKARGKV